MPIKNLTTVRRLPRLGKIHLGVKAKNAQGAEYPKATDYFVCPPEVQKIFGAEPKELRVLIPLEDEERWASQYYRCYSRSRGLVCKGDGETATRMVNMTTGEMAWKEDAKTPVTMKTDLPCKGRECPDYVAKHCREIMNLQVLIPEVPGLGVYQVDTSSINSILNINSEAELIRRLHGRISGLPLLLTLEPQEAKTPEGVKKTVHVLHLRTKLVLAEMMALSLKKPEQVIVELHAIEDEYPEIFGDGVPEEPPVSELPATVQVIEQAATPPTVVMATKPTTNALARQQTVEDGREAINSQIAAKQVPTVNPPARPWPTKSELDEFATWCKQVRGFIATPETMTAKLGMTMTQWLHEGHTLAEARLRIQEAK